MVQHSPRYQPPLQNEEEKLPFDTKWGYRKNVLFQQCLICVNVFTKFDCVYFTLFKLIQFVHWNKRYMLVRWLALGPQFHVAIAYAVCYSFHIIFFPYFPRLYARSLFCWQARRPLFGVCPPNANSEKG